MCKIFCTVSTLVHIYIVVFSLFYFPLFYPILSHVGESFKYLPIPKFGQCADCMFMLVYNLHRPHSLFFFLSPCRPRVLILYPPLAQSFRLLWHFFLWGFFYQMSEFILYPLPNEGCMPFRRIILYNPSEPIRINSIILLSSFHQFISSFHFPSLLRYFTTLAFSSHTFQSRFDKILFVLMKPLQFLCLQLL